MQPITNFCRKNINGIEQCTAITFKAADNQVMSISITGTSERKSYIYIYCFNKMQCNSKWMQLTYEQLNTDTSVALVRN